ATEENGCTSSTTIPSAFLLSAASAQSWVLAVSVNAIGSPQALCLVHTREYNQVVTMNHLISSFIAQDRLNMRRPLAADGLEFGGAVIHQPLREALCCHIYPGDRVAKTKVAGYSHHPSREEAFALCRQSGLGAVIDDDFAAGFERIADPALAA